MKRKPSRHYAYAVVVALAAYPIVGSTASEIIDVLSIYEVYYWYTWYISCFPYVRKKVGKKKSRVHPF